MSKEFLLCSPEVKSYKQACFALKKNISRQRHWPGVPFPRPCKCTFDLLTLNMVSESCVTSATCVPILVFLYSLSVLELFPMLYHVRDRQTSESIIA